MQLAAHSSHRCFVFEASLLSLEIKISWYIIVQSFLFFSKSFGAGGMKSSDDVQAQLELHIKFLCIITMKYEYKIMSYCSPCCKTRLRQLRAQTQIVHSEIKGSGHIFYNFQITFYNLDSRTHKHRQFLCVVSVS